VQGISEGDRTEGDLSAHLELRQRGVVAVAQRPSGEQPSQSGRRRSLRQRRTFWAAGLAGAAGRYSAPRNLDDGRDEASTHTGLIKHHGIDFDIVYDALGYNIAYFWRLWKPTVDELRRDQPLIYKEWEQLAKRIAAIDPQIKLDAQGEIVWRDSRSSAIDLYPRPMADGSEIRCGPPCTGLIITGYEGQDPRGSRGSGRNNDCSAGKC
jgi:hypothetical protein